MAGMPANDFDLERFARNLVTARWMKIRSLASDPGDEATDEQYRRYNESAPAIRCVPAVREGLRYCVSIRFRFLDREVASGPGRFDTFGPEKASLNWPWSCLATAGID